MEKKNQMAERLDKYMQYVMNPNISEPMKATYYTMIAGLQNQRTLLIWRRRSLSRRPSRCRHPVAGSGDTVRYSHSIPVPGPQRVLWNGF